MALALALAQEGRRLDLICWASCVMANHRTSAKKGQVVGSLSFLHQQCMCWQPPHTRNNDTHRSLVCRADQLIPAVIHCYVCAIRERPKVVDVEKVKDSQVELEEAVLTRVRGGARQFGQSAQRCFCCIPHAPKCLAQELCRTFELNP